MGSMYSVEDAVSENQKKQYNKKKTQKKRKKERKIFMIAY